MELSSRLRTIPQFGRAVERDRVAIAAAALRKVRTLIGVPAAVRGESVEALVLHYARSMSDGHTMGLAAWARRCAPLLGPEGVVEIIVTVSETLLRTAELHANLDRDELALFLEALETRLVALSASHMSLRLRTRSGTIPRQPTRLHVEPTVDVEYRTRDVARLVFE
jgi:hypothetical protein